MAFKLAVTGGKGGTGKSVVAVNLAMMLQEKNRKVLLVDADVDSPSDFFLLGKKPVQEKEVNNFMPLIDENKCIKCGVCIKECPEHALFMPLEKPPSIVPKLCNGCKKCQLVCPTKAIEDGERKIGVVRTGEAEGLKIISGDLIPTEPFSAKVVDSVLEKMKEEEKEYDVVIIDVAAGTHCNVIHALYESDYAIVVTEPTPFGTKDAEEITSILKKINKPYSLILNKAGISNEKPKEQPLEEIPYNKKFVKYYLEGKPFVKERPEHKISKIFERIATHVLEKAKEERK